jgi:hypothetical protein
VIHANLVPSAAKGMGKLYQWLVTDRLRDYRAWVNATPRGILMAMAMRGF